MLHKFIHIYFLPCLLSLGYTIGLGFWDYLLEAKDVIFFILISELPPDIDKSL